jgi:hypothetical protein
MKTKLIIIGLAMVILCSCDDKKQTTGSTAPLPMPPFDHATISELTPMSDGSAYASSADSRLWYIRGDKAVRVTIGNDVSRQLPEFSEITPAADGSAYGVPLNSDDGLWHLHAEHAEKISEVTSLADLGPLPKTSDKVSYSLYLSEHKKRKVAEDRLDEIQNPPEPDP